MLNIESVALKKSKPLCFAIKEKLLKSDGVKGNDENMMKKQWSNSLSSWKWEWRCVFFGWFFKQNYSE